MMIIHLDTLATLRVRDTLAAGYRELAAANRSLGFHDLAEQCEERASTIEADGRVAWTSLVEDREAT